MEKKKCQIDLPKIYMCIAKVDTVASAFKLKSPKKFRSLIQKLTLQHHPRAGSAQPDSLLREACAFVCVCVFAQP